MIVEANRLLHCLHARTAVETTVQGTRRTGNPHIEEPGVLDGQIVPLSAVPERVPVDLIQELWIERPEGLLQRSRQLARPDRLDERLVGILERLGEEAIGTAAHCRAAFVVSDQPLQNLRVHEIPSCAC